MSAEKRGRWNSRTGFLIAAIGSAVGLGNIWRFPYIAYKNGGGAFLIPYIIAMLFVGVPLLIAEQGIGNHFRGSPALSFFKINKKWEWLGWWSSVIVSFAIMLYYTVVIGWCINYLIYSIDLSWGFDTEGFFHNTFLGISEGAFDIGGFQPGIILGTLVVWVSIWWISVRGVNRGLELANRICVPLLGMLMITMMLWTLALPGSIDGIVAFFKPDVSKLLDPCVWTDAFSQVFFSLSVAIGIMIAYSSYLKPKASIVENSWITAIADTGFAIFAGMVVFATLGTMAYAAELPISEVVKGGPGLAFVTYPKAISLLPFGSNIFGILFFLSLIFAGITSGISILEAFVCSAVDKFQASRTKVVTITCMVGFVGSLIFTTRSGIFWLDIVDYFVMNFGLLAIGLLEALVIGWILGSSKMGKYINEGSRLKVGRVWGFSMKFIIPIVLGVLLIREVISLVDKPYGGYSWKHLGFVGIGWFIFVIFMSVVFSKMRWRKRKEN